jgi:ubiquinone/menaquinone biosynthesis C-methylase UbiE
MEYFAPLINGSLHADLPKMNTITDAYRDTGVQKQKRVDDHFNSTAAYWSDVYQTPTAWGAIFTQRRDLALAWTDGLALSSRARVLEVGGGNGSTAVALAQRGFVVDVIDSSEAMVEATRRHAVDSGQGTRLSATLGDVHHLQFESGVFDVVIALGVIPWLHSPIEGIREMARVLKPGGYLIVTSDNRAALHHAIDPKLNPLLTELKIGLKRFLWRTLGMQRPEVARAYFGRFVDQLLAEARLNKITRCTIGFGPFSFLGVKMFSDSVDVRLHRYLQRQADRGFPVLRAIGGQHAVLARKPVS